MLWPALKHVVTGLICWLIGAFLLTQDQDFKARSEPVQLVVLRIESQLNDKHERRYRAVFALDTPTRPRPEHAANVWLAAAPHRAGEIVAGRYDPNSGEMRSDAMRGLGHWIGRIAHLIGIVATVQALLLLFGVPELLLPLRVKVGS